MKHGFTLVELLIYMGLMAAFLTVLTSIFLSALDVQTQSEATSSVEDDGRYILSRLVYDIHRASSVTVPASNGQTANSLSLNVGTYTLSGGKLQINGSDNLNSYATTLSSFSVTRLGNSGGKPTLTISFSLKDNSETKTYQTTVSMR